MHNFFWIGGIVGGIAAAVLLVASLALSADLTEAAVRAMQALCCVMIPYVMARAGDELGWHWRRSGRRVNV